LERAFGALPRSFNAHRWVSQAIETICSSLGEGGQLLLEQGSAADAQHIEAEVTGRFFRDRKPLHTLALGNTSTLTSRGNDYCYEYVFAREFSEHARPGDIQLVISTRGNGLNVLRMIKVPTRIV
jgi:D-sedoheptulose 7-phosphate isomerase